MSEVFDLLKLSPNTTVKHSSITSKILSAAKMYSSIANNGSER